MKAHTHRNLTFHDISILKAHQGEERLGGRAPYARIKAAPGDERDSTALLSLSHDGDYAVAICLADKASRV
jgi:holo-[acyl-carrier protein] synthase